MSTDETPAETAGESASSFDLRSELPPIEEARKQAQDESRDLNTTEGTPKAIPISETPLHDEISTLVIVGPPPPASTIKPDSAVAHRKTKPAQTVEEAAAKAGKIPLGPSRSTVSDEEAKKLTDEETKRVIARYLERKEAMEKVPDGINPIKDQDFEKFVRSHLSYVNMFYVVTGQPVGELLSGPTSESLQTADTQAAAGLDPALRGMKAAQFALEAGWNPNSPELE